MASLSLPAFHRLSMHALQDKGGVSAILSQVNLDDLYANNWLLDAVDAVVNERINLALYAIASDLVLFLDPSNCPRWQGEQDIFSEFSIQLVQVNEHLKYLFTGRWMEWGAGGVQPTFEFRCHKKADRNWVGNPIFSTSVDVRLPILVGGSTEQYKSWADLCNLPLSPEERRKFADAIYNEFTNAGIGKSINDLIKHPQSLEKDRSGPLTPRETRGTRGTREPQTVPPKRPRRV